METVVLRGGRRGLGGGQAAGRAVQQSLLKEVGRVGDTGEWPSK